MQKTALLLMILTILSKITGFGREITLSYFYGASIISDVFLISLTIPYVIFSFIGVGLSTGYTPLYSTIEQKYGGKEAIRYTNNLVNILFILCTGIVVFGLIFTNQIVKIFASGFEGSTLQLAVQFTRIGLLGIYFTGIINIFSGFLRIKGNYAIPSLVGFPMNFFLILSILLSSKMDNLMLLAVGSLIATISQLVLLVPFVKKKGYKYVAIVDFKDEYIKKMLVISLPVIIGVSVSDINMLVDKTLASSITVGGISALNYASKIEGFVKGMFGATVATAMYPRISKLAAQGNYNGLKNSVSEAINLVNLFVIPATVGVLIFAEPIVKLLFGRGSFDHEAIAMTANVLFYYSIGMVASGVREILPRVFYAMHDTKTPMSNAALSMVINIFLNILLSRFLGLGGLALATGISNIICTGLLLTNLRKKIGPFGMKNTVISYIKILMSSLVMGTVAIFAYRVLLLHVSENLSLIISIGTGTIVYFVVIYFMKIKEVDDLVNKAKKKLKI